MCRNLKTPKHIGAFCEAAPALFSHSVPGLLIEPRGWIPSLLVLFMLRGSSLDSGCSVPLLQPANICLTFKAQFIYMHIYEAFPNSPN